MTEWPEPFALRNCIDWNRESARIAVRDASNDRIAVPASATRRIFEEGRAKIVRLTQEEYRDQRWADADRHERNIQSLEARLS